MRISLAGARRALVAGLLPLSVAIIAALATTPAVRAQQKPPAAAPAAPAAPAEKPADPDALPPSLAEMDTNNDKAVDQKEFVTAQMKTFDEVDTNKDGFVTREEYLKQAEPPFIPADAKNLPPIEQRRRVLNNRFTALDANQDGKISREEVEQSFVREFVVLDRDQNSRLTSNDIRLARAQEQAANPPERITREEFVENENVLFGRLDVNNDQFLTREEFLALANGAPAGSVDQVKARLTSAFTSLDTNKDAKVSKAEWQAASERNFAQADRNKDGVLTGDELRPQQAPAAPTPPTEVTRDQFVTGQTDDILAQFDKNKDGKLSLDEFLVLASTAPPQNANEAKARLTATFKGMDGNKNSFVERAELLAHFTNIFNRLDADKNGKVSQKEMSGPQNAPPPAAQKTQPPAQNKPPAAAKPAAPKPAPKPAPQPAPQGGPPPAYPPSSGGGQAPITTVPGSQPLR